MNDQSAPGTVAVRRPDGSLVFVEGVPPMARAGDTVRYRGAMGEARGTIAIPSTLLMLCADSVPRAGFVSLEESAVSDESGCAEPLAVARSSVEPPGGPDSASMLRLAWEELDRLTEP